MNKDDMKHRTRQFALRVIRLVESLPKGQRIAKPQPSLKCLPARQFVRREVNSCLPPPAGRAGIGKESA